MANLTYMRIVSLGELESNLGSNRLPAYIESCEKVIADQIVDIKNKVISSPQVKLIFVSGPTSSGKTTFSTRLAEALTAAGKEAHLVSMDDYYSLYNLDFDEQGRPDFESIDTLDLELLHEHLSLLLKGKAVSLPKFNFATRSRSWPQDHFLQLAEDDLVIVEGLHGLSPLVSADFPSQYYFGIFIMPWCSFHDGRQLLGSKDLRILRRVSRDSAYRGASAMSTIDYWPMIERNEQLFIPEYLSRANAYVNSCLPYEFCIIVPRAAKEIAKSLEQYENGTLPESVFLSDHENSYADLATALEEARYLYAASARIPQISADLIPKHSILNEFV